MDNIKRKYIIIIILIAIPVIFLINELLLYLAPSNLEEGDKIKWFAAWSSSLSFITVLIIAGLLYRYFTNKKD